MKILITGAAGFAGLNFMEYFSTKYDVTGFFDYTIADYPEILYKKFNDKTISGTINNRKDIINLIKNTDVIIHEEALIEAPKSVMVPLLFHIYNVNGFLNILECARKYNTKVICVGSNISYGEPIFRPITENHPQNPNSPYGATRVCQEKYALSYHYSYDLPVIVLRYSNLYGPFGKGVINEFIKNAILNNKIVLTGAGLQTRTYTYIMDAAKATELAINSNKAVGNIYNVAGIETINLVGLVRKLRKYFPDLKVEYVDHWKGDILSSNYEISIEKINKELGYYPKYNLKKGIKETIDWTYQYLT